MVSTNRSISSKVLEQAQKLDQANMTAALRGAWPPKKPVYNQYFFDLDSVIRNPKVVKPLSIALLNIMFKVDLKRLIQDRGRYSEEFIFTLITGSGDLVDKGIVSKTAEVIPEANSTTVLMELISNPLTIYKLEKPKNYRQAFERNPDGAKLKYNLVNIVSIVNSKENLSLFNAYGITELFFQGRSILEVIINSAGVTLPVSLLDIRNKGTSLWSIKIPKDSNAIGMDLSKLNLPFRAIVFGKIDSKGNPYQSTENIDIEEGDNILIISSNRNEETMTRFFQGNSNV